MTHRKSKPRSGKFELDKEIKEETKIGYPCGDMIDPRHAQPTSQK